MPPRREATWPALLFIVTVVSGLLSTAATFTYYRYTTRFQDQERELTEKRRQYEIEIEDLKKKVVGTKTITQSIPTPVTSTRRVCTNFPIVGDVCSDVPEVRIEQRQVPVTVQGEDPAVKQALDQKLKDLEALSTRAVATQKTQVDFKELVDSLRQLVAPIVSILVTFASLFVIVSAKYKAESEKWAYGSLGTILGFWLK